MVKKLICIFLLAQIFSNAIIAQPKKEMDVLRAVESLRKAMIDADSNALNKLISNSLSYGHSSGKVQTKAEFMHSLTSGESDFVAIDLTNQTIQVFGKTAIVRHTLDAKTNDSNKPGTVKLMILTVWMKEHGKWKLLARQAVKPPV
jgi:hypothetical protein